MGRASERRAILVLLVTVHARAQLRVELCSPDEVRIWRDVSYASASGWAAAVPPAAASPAALRLDVYAPSEGAGGAVDGSANDEPAARPLAVLVHGGALRAGDKADAKVASWAVRFARRGYVAASVNYRLLLADGASSAAAARAAALDDVAAAVRFLRLPRAVSDAFPRLAPRVWRERAPVLFGASAGASLVLALAFGAEVSDRMARRGSLVSLNEQRAVAVVASSRCARSETRGMRIWPLHTSP